MGPGGPDGGSWVLGWGGRTVTVLARGEPSAACRGGGRIRPTVGTAQLPAGPWDGWGAMGLGVVLGTRGSAGGTRGSVGDTGQCWRLVLFLVSLVCTERCGVTLPSRAYWYWLFMVVCTGERWALALPGGWSAGGERCHWCHCCRWWCWCC